MTEIDQIMAVMVAAFDPLWGEAWNRRQVEEVLALHHTGAVVIDKHGMPVADGDTPPAGFLLARHAADEAELLLIAVMPEYRGRGLGARLIELLCKQVRDRGGNRIFLEMRQNNPAERLYLRAGFEPIGRRTNYYRTADGGRLDAITFGLTIDRG